MKNAVQGESMKAVDPVRYETFFHRLWAIGEEGR
jgi:hypothetical protein